MKKISPFQIAPTLAALVLGSVFIGQNDVLAQPAAAANRDITVWVVDALRDDPRTMFSEIQVSTENGIVTLEGSVESLLTKVQAQREAEKIVGVVRVNNAIQVNPRPRSDRDVLQNVRRRILNNVVLQDQTLRTRVNAGVLQCSGEVNSWSEVEQVELLFSEIPGLVAVNLDLTVRSANVTRSDGDMQKDVQATINHDAYLTGLGIAASVNSGVVTLSGNVSSSYEKNLAVSKARRVSGIKEVSDQISVNASAKGRTAHPVVSDEELIRISRQELNLDPRVDATKMDLAVSRGHVTMTGSVPSLNQVYVAEQTVRNLVGVAKVTNKLRARPESRSDQAIEDDLAFELALNEIVHGQDIHIKSRNGVVVFTGKVNTWYGKRRAQDTASRVLGVREIRNQLAIARAGSQPDNALRDAVQSRLKRDWVTASSASKIQVTVKNGVATLAGSVDTWAERKEARRVANRTPGVWMVDNRIQVNGWDYPWETWYHLGPYDYNSQYAVWYDRYR